MSRKLQRHRENAVKGCVAEEHTYSQLSFGVRHRQNAPKGCVAAPQIKTSGMRHTGAGRKACVARCWECEGKKLYLYKF